jgi:glycosyltransferase involved in cell wall biosynthesis
LFGGWNIKQNILYSRLLRFSRTKTGFFSDHPDDNKNSFLKKLIKTLIIKSADYLFVTSESAQKYFTANFNISKGKIKIFPYAHNYDFEYQPNNQNDKIKIFIANRFIERKGHHIVLESFRLLREKMLLDSFDIVIAGGGEQYKFYKDKYLKLSEFINVYEWIENDEYISHLKSSNIYLHASIFEPFGIPPLDAMQLGKVVIVSDGVKSLNTFLNRSKGLMIYPANEANV